MTRTQPRSSAEETLPIDCSMKAAGRKMPASTVTPDRPGLSSSSAWSMPRVISSVFPHGNFSTTSSSPGWPLMMASPISG